MTSTASYGATGDDRSVEVTEVGTRDGLQIENKLVPAAQKIDLIDRMIDACGAQ